MRWRPLMLKKSLLKEGRSDLSQLLLQYLVLELSRRLLLVLLPAPPLVELSFLVPLAMALEGKWELGPGSWCRSRATWCRGRLKELSEGAEGERGTAAEEAISRQKRTIPGLAGPVAALGAAAAGAVPLVAAPLVAAVGAGPLVAGHFAKKLGFKAGFHHALKGKDVKQALVKKPQVKGKQD